MKYLIDTNVLLEVALQRTRSREASDFLRGTPTVQMAVAEFSLFSVGFYLWKTPDTFDALVRDVHSKNLPLLHLEPVQLPLVTKLGKMHQLSFDDAVIYTIAELHNLEIVSFDADFDRTPRRRIVPTAQP